MGPSYSRTGEVFSASVPGGMGWVENSFGASKRDPCGTTSSSPGPSFTAQPQVLGKAKGGNQLCSVVFTVPTSEGPFSLQTLRGGGGGQGRKGFHCSAHPLPYTGFSSKYNSS